MCRRILVDSDVSQSTKRASRKAIGLTQQFGAELRITAVVESTSVRVSGPGIRQDILNHGNAVLSEAIDQSKGEGVPRVWAR